MATDFNAFVSQNNDRAVDIAKILIKAAKETHTMLIQSEKKSKRAREAMEMRDKEAMWAVLQEVHTGILLFYHRNRHLYRYRYPACGQSVL